MSRPPKHQIPFILRNALRKVFAPPLLLGNAMAQATFPIRDAAPDVILVRSILHICKQKTSTYYIYRYSSFCPYYSVMLSYQIATRAQALALHTEGMDCSLIEAATGISRRQIRYYVAEARKRGYNP
ncbi:hypothetical protein K469DRAFT_795487 [Zopfia rhizophila CBS 207.26]|uniref:Uncharacterized protein n=1 Tax=Zopfia rhizophila CBS 207.26 TaxID=1314779 RepID=A0A6A6ET18_9PEZI|nr:hypothetical protein K469DRAFT_795487 [Zopfia rhizophila CBS 207.26]